MEYDGHSSGYRASWFGVSYLNMVRHSFIPSPYQSHSRGYWNLHEPVSLIHVLSHSLY